MWGFVAFFGFVSTVLFPRQAKEVAAVGVKIGSEVFGPIKNAIQYGPQELLGPFQPVNANDLDVMARTIWGEARNQGYAGMQAVANVIMNRVRYSKQKGGYWWGNGVAGVCQKRAQFSVWLPSDPNYRLINAITDKDATFRLCKTIANDAIRGALKDITGNADYYHTTGIMPTWAKGKIPTARIGDHVFYRIDSAVTTV